MSVVIASIRLQGFLEAEVEMEVLLGELQWHGCVYTSFAICIAILGSYAWKAVDSYVTIYSLCIAESSWCFFLYFEVVEAAVPDEERKDNGEEGWTCPNACDDSPYFIDAGNAVFVFGIHAVLLEVHLFVDSERDEKANQLSCELSYWLHEENCCHHSCSSFGRGPSIE